MQVVLLRGIQAKVSLKGNRRIRKLEIMSQLFRMNKMLMSKRILILMMLEMGDTIHNINQKLNKIYRRHNNSNKNKIKVLFRRKKVCQERKSLIESNKNKYQLNGKWSDSRVHLLKASKNITMTLITTNRHLKKQNKTLTNNPPNPHRTQPSPRPNPNPHPNSNPPTKQNKTRNKSLLQNK